MEERQQPNWDRISALPDALIHHILSHLDAREVVHTSILSNRWRYIWLSTPYLDFNLDYWERRSPKPYLEARQSFMNFVENVLIRRGASQSRNIFKLRLYTYDSHFDFDLPRVSSFIKTCLEQNVQHLILRFPLGALKPDNVDLTSFLPPNLFSSNLRDLEISFVPVPLIPLPNIVHGSIIKNLKLHGVILPQGNANGELIFNSTLLEALEIDLCDVDHLTAINVSAPLLHTLYFRLLTRRKQNESFWWSSSSIHQEENARNVKMKVNVNAPNIKSLGLVTSLSKYFFPVDYSIESELLSLVSASIHITTDKFVDDECSQHLIKILRRVYHARALQLTICTKQVLNDFPMLLEGFPHQFQNTRYIKLADQMKYPCLHAITNFLSSFPLIETLVWNRNWNEWYGITDEAGESIASETELLRAGLSQNMFSCLKTVEFRNLEGNELEFQFLVFLMERAMFLKTVSIQFNGALTSAELTEFKEKCLCLPRSSANASVVFLKDI